MFPLLRPALHAGALGWDEYLLILAGLIVLIVIATTGRKQDKDQSTADSKHPSDES